MKLRHLALMMLINLLWGFNLVSAKVGVDGFGPLLFTTLRFALLSVVLAPFLRVRRNQVAQLLAVSLASGGLHFALIFAGLSRADDVSTVAIAIQLSVPFAALLSVFFLGERVGWMRVCGIGLAFSGVLVIGLDPQVLNYIDGLALVIAGAFAGAVSMLLMKNLHRVSVFELQAWIAVLSLPVLIPLTLIFEDGQARALAQAGWLQWSTVAYTALAASLIGHGGFYFLLQRYDVSLMAPLTLIATPVAVLCGVLILGDQLTGRMLTGAVITLAGVLLVTLREPARGHAARERPR